jgi:tRNA(fMet)-specific endonuclease VapC
LDTSTVSRAQGPQPDRAVIDRLAAVAGDSALPSVALHELLYGTAVLPFGRKRRDLERFIQLAVRPLYPILAYDEAAADWHARERARLRSLGKTPPFRDGQIAAIAATNGLTVVTANVRDFAAFDVGVEDWSSPR